MEDERNSSIDTLSTAASATNTLRGAVKTGKAVTKIAQGAATGGPHGAVAAGLWEGRKTVVKIIAIAAFILFLPILYILMLPSLIFGSGGLDSVPDHVLNDNSVILANLTDVETTIENILYEKHNQIIAKIKQEGDSLGSDCDYTIIDDFADSIVYESTLIISQFCASQGDYQEINLPKLKQMIEAENGLFSYSTVITSEEVTAEDGSKETIYHYTYTVNYAGDAYFAEHIFQLTDEQSSLALEYANNLNVFLYDTAYKVEINPNLRPGETGNAAVDLALTKIGTPSSQGKRNQPGYFDCSSFCYWAYNQVGVQLMYEGSNTAAAQGRYIVENNLAVSYENLAPGDLVFYSFETNNRFMNISHMGIYCGDGYIVDASSGRGKVVYRPIYSINRIVLCGRPYVVEDEASPTEQSSD